MLHRITQTTSRTLKANFSKSLLVYSQKKVAVILSGCGYLDGNDVIETSALDIQLSKHNLSVSYFAPTEEIQNTYIYSTRKIDAGEERYPHKEGARIVHSPVSPINQLKPSEFSTLIIPGGDGVLTNLSNYLVEPSEFSVDRKVESIIKDFWKDKKLIIAPGQSALLVGKILGTKNGGPGVTVTFGGNEDSHAPECRKLGNETAEIKEATDYHFDEKNKIISTPLNLWEGIQIVDVFETTGAIVNKIQ